MLQVLFGGITGLSLLYGLIKGQGEAVAAAMLSGAEEAVQVPSPWRAASRFSAA